MPGNPALAMLSKFHGQLDPAALKALEILFGINTNKPAARAVRHLPAPDGDRATSGPRSTFYPATVSSVIGSAIWWTLGLVGITTILAFVLGTGLGIISRLAPRRRGWTACCRRCS